MEKHADFLLADSHTDFLTAMKKTQRKHYAQKTLCKCGKVVCAVFTTNKKIGIKQIKKYKKEIENYNKKFSTNLLLSVEDIGFVKTQKQLKSLIKLKPFSVTLTWNEQNQYAGGANSKIGLTTLGGQTVKRLEQNNILVDTAHLSRKAFFDVAKITRFPIFNSHANLCAIKKHNRNLTNKQLQLIAKTGGFVGLTVYQNFIANSQITTKNIAQQFEYLKTRFGIKNFGLGTDLFGFNEEFLPKDFAKYEDVTNLSEEMQKTFNEKEIKDILINNFENFSRVVDKTKKI